MGLGYGLGYGLGLRLGLGLGLGRLCGLASSARRCSSSAPEMGELRRREIVVSATAR